MPGALVDLSTFQHHFNDQDLSFYKPLYVRHADIIKVKRETTALPNLRKIFLATLSISASTGFQSMGLRDLSAATGISLGALYSYIDSKEQLLHMIIGHVIDCLKRGLGDPAQWPEAPQHRLAHLIRAHLYLSEVLAPWFYFTFMEARHVTEPGDTSPDRIDALVDTMIHDCLELARSSGILRWDDTGMATTLIRPLIQDWYVKRQKFEDQGLPVEYYADAVTAFVEQAVFYPQ